MRILVVSTHDSRGGAGKAAYRFSNEFIKQGHEVCLYVQSKKEEDSFIKESTTPKIIAKLLHLLDFLPGYLLSGFNADVNFTLGLFGENLEKVVNQFKPDVINVHWTWKGFISFPQICKISKQVPVVWTMHDYSPFSDGIFYPSEIKTPLLRILVNVNKRIRKIAFKQNNIAFVSPSKFLLNEFYKSPISKVSDGYTINNGIDLTMFHKQDKQLIKESLGWDTNRRYILFGAVNLMDNEVKGGQVLKEVLKKMEEYLLEKNVGLVSFGSQNPFEDIGLSQKIEQIFLGYIKSEKVAELMTASEVMLVPSRYENYPFVVMESLCSGTPVVAFKVGGIPEIIDEPNKGYLAIPSPNEDYLKGIKYVLEHPIKSWNNEVYDISVKGREYIELFNNCIKAGRS